MKKKIEVILALCLLCCGQLYANPVDTEEAHRKAVQFLTEKNTTDGRRMAPARTPRMKLAHQRTTTEGQPAFYIFNNEAGGFVIVSGDDRAESILGFSDSGQFDATDIPDGLQSLLNGYEEQITAVARQQGPAPHRASSSWADIGPLIQTHWDQDYAPFNTLCPIDPDNGKRCITGCVATAVAQLLYYHKWPETGYGSTSYEWRDQTLTTDFTQARFEYDKMKPKYDYNNGGQEDEDNAVATLLYYCAMAAHADFTSSGTWGWVSTSDIRRLFGYKEAKSLNLSSTTISSFESTAYEELQAKRPLLLSSNDPDNGWGHLMIIDGYQSGGFFHVNLGWSGNCDGYYKLTAINTEWGNYKAGQSIIYNLEPDYNAPLEAGVYPKESYQLSEDGETLLKWTGDESFIHLGADAALWGVTEIGEKAFEDCTGLEAIFIPSQITYIGKSPFAGCTNLQSINVDANNERYHESNGLLIDAYNYVRASSATSSLIIPETVSNLYSQAFSNCTDLKQITMMGNNPVYPYNNCFHSDMDYSAVTLYVPQQSLSQYRNHSFWGKFTNIVGVSEPVSKKLTVETTTGQKKEYMLYQMPVMKNNGTKLEITTRSGQSVSYDLEKLKKMTFVDNNELGNTNGRGGVDVADVAALVSHLKNKTPQGFDPLAADINQDGRVDGDDVDALVAVIIGRREALALQDGQTAGLGTEPAGQSPDDAAMYIYLNDGSRLKAFLMSQVAHVSYSCTGLDGLTYDIPVTQLVQTRDSLYRIPIAAIDSINYQTPEPIMKKGLFIIDETNVGDIASFDFDNYTITFKSSTPAARRPKQGQVVYSDLVEDPLPMGFSGRITKVNGNVYTWESAGPEEVFDRLLVVGRIEPNGTHSYSTRRFMPYRREHAEPTYNIKCELLKPLMINGKGQIIADYTIDLNVFNSEPAIVDITWQHDVEFGINLTLLKNESVLDAINCPWNPNEKIKELWLPPVPLFTFWGIEVYGMLGSYYSFEGDFSVELSGLKYKYSNKERIIYNSQAEDKFRRIPIHHEKGWNFDDLADNIKLKAELEGKLSFGLCVEFDVAIWKPNWASLGFNIKCGPELKGSISLDTDLLKTMANGGFESALYKEFSENVKLELGLKLGLDILARLGYREWKLANISTTLYPTTVSLLPKLSKPALPEIYKIGENNFFVETAYRWDHVDPIKVKTKATNATLFPGPIGLSIYDSKGNELYNHFAEDRDRWHWVKASTIQTSLLNYEAQTVKVYPQYKLFGFFPIKGEPAEINIPEPMTLAATTATVEEGKTVTVDINGGWGYYSAGWTNDGTAKASVKKRSDGTHYLKISGVKAGTAAVIVKDVRSERTQTVEVSVTPTPIKFSAMDIKMRLGETKIVTASPMAAYTVKSSAPDVASVFIDQNSVSAAANQLTAFQITALSAGTATITVTDPEHSRKATLQVEVKPLDGVTDAAEAIDLGLPSGMLWASWNIGASAPEEAGSYYAWGETLEKANYSWSTYLHSEDYEETVRDIGDNIGFTEYDVANKQWGGLWRLPTWEDFYELTKNCTKKWEQLNGQWGMRFTGPNGNSIFMPAAGYFDGKTLNEESSEGYYWAGNIDHLSACYANEPLYLKLYNNSAGSHYSKNLFTGYTIRPVKFAGFDNYEHGICSNPYPADGETLGSTSYYLSCNANPLNSWNENYEVRISDKPDMSHTIGTCYTRSIYSLFWKPLQPNTTYYWQVSIIYYDSDSSIKCSPIWSFTTGPE